MQKKALTASLLMLLARMLERLIGFISIIILARLLTPYDYGVVAVSQVIVFFFLIMIGDGAEAYLLRKEQISENDYNTAWTVRILLTLCVGYALFFFRVPLAGFMNTPELVDILILSSLSNIILGFENIGIIKYKREFNYKPIFFQLLLTKIAGFMVTTTLALLTKSYWALIIGVFVLNSSMTLFSYVFCNYRPRFTLINFSQQWSFSKWLFISNITVFIRNKINDIVIPKYLGVDEMGKYSVAYNIANIPYEQVILPILAPVYSSYRTVLKAPEKLSDMFIKVVSIVTIIILPIYSGLYLLASDIILLILGDKWQIIIPIFKYLLCFIVIQAYFFLIHSFLLSLGLVKIISLVNWGMVGILLPSTLYWVSHYGLEEVVFFRILIAIFFLLIYSGVLASKSQLDWLKMGRTIIRPIIATVIMFLSGMIMMVFWQGYYFPVIIFQSVFIYVSVLLLLWRRSASRFGGEYYIIENIIDLLEKKGGHQIMIVWIKMKLKSILYK